MIVVLDSNIWIAEFGLRSSLGALARFYIHRKNARLGLPEVIRLEVEHNLRNQIQRFTAAIEDAHRQLLMLFGTLKQVVVPNASAIDTKVGELFRDVGIDIIDVPFSLKSARSSYLKTIDKTPPSDKTQEFKDGVLWADCIELLEGDDVCLVTKDKAFFEGREYSNGLSKALVAETTSARHQFSLMPSLAELVKELRVDVSIDEDKLVQAYLAKNADLLTDMLNRNGFVLGDRHSLAKTLYVTEQPSVLYVEFSMEFIANEIAGDGRSDGIVTAIGDGTYDAHSHIFSNLRNRGETLRFQQSDGSEVEKKNYYAFMEGLVIGHRDVSYTVRRELP